MEININMTDIKPITTAPIQQTATTGLSNEDITRLPRNYDIPATGLQADTYESSNGKRGIIMPILLAAAAVVGLKHCGFMKVTPESTGFIANFIKKPIAKVGGIIEWPFVKLMELFKSSKAKEELTEEAKEVAENVKEGFFKRCLNKIKSVFKRKPKSA